MYSVSSRNRRMVTFGVIVALEVHENAAGYSGWTIVTFIAHRSEAQNKDR